MMSNISGKVIIKHMYHNKEWYFKKKIKNKN